MMSYFVYLIPRLSTSIISCFISSDSADLFHDILDLNNSSIVPVMSNLCFQTKLKTILTVFVNVYVWFASGAVYTDSCEVEAFEHLYAQK